MEEPTQLKASQPKVVAIQTPISTPTHSPSKRPVMITQSQKQALIDNLQLEVTERARKLRAQYALQAQSLRTRIELRVNRIPTAMRKANMGDLYEKYLESIKSPQKEDEPSLSKTESTQLPNPSSPSKKTTKAPSPSKYANTTATTQEPRGTKRSSNHITPNDDDDKENTPDPTNIPLSSKKRPKHNPQPSNPSAILSPKSSNARTITANRNPSPSRPHLGSPVKTSYFSHPTSPLKPNTMLAANLTSPAKAAAVAATATTTAPTSKATRTRATAAPKVSAAKSKAKTAPITRAKRGAEPSALANK
ncbi:MAG: hypothetical protein Q9222_002880, partial [Ikaeria aurantiellina]